MVETDPTLRFALSDSFTILKPGQGVKLDLGAEALGISRERLKRALNPPHAPSITVMHDVAVKTPFTPLEKLAAPETRAWVERQNKKFRAYIGRAARAEKAPKAAPAPNPQVDMYSGVSHMGDNYFRTCKKAGAAQQHIEMSSALDGPWRKIIDPNTLSADGTVSMPGWYPSPDGKRVAYLLSEGGKDARTIHVFDAETGETLPDVPETRALPSELDGRVLSVLWEKGGHDGFFYTDRSGDAKYHVLGRPAAGDKTVFASAPGCWAHSVRFPTAQHAWVYQVDMKKTIGTFCRPHGSDEPFKEVMAQGEAVFYLTRELDDGSVLALTDKDAPRKKLISFRPENPSPQEWRTIIPERDDAVLLNVAMHKERLVAFYLEDMAHSVKVFTVDGQHLHDVPLPAQSLVSTNGIYQDGQLSWNISSFKSAGDTYAYDIETNELSLKEQDSAANLNDCIVERLYATSRDGTKVPMTVVRHPDTQLDGTAAVLMRGYGGFAHALGPTYSEEIRHFVSSGGIFVQTNLRGGGEYGRTWHDQGRQHNKQNVFDDFAACAWHLIRQKYTGRKRLVIEGGSNGGLLTSATMLQYPRLFGAVITHVPVTDMLGLNGAWSSDYGRPDSIREDFNIAARYSPVHNVKRDAKYPPHLILTGDHDDRVMPWHAYKLAAALQTQSHEDNVVLLRVTKNAGHGAGKSTAQAREERADVFAFIEKAIGPVSQQAYKKLLETGSSAAPVTQEIKIVPGAPGTRENKLG